ncbi:MAG: HupE/UreJ family protein [Gammaproteobacteria bacterium]
MNRINLLLVWLVCLLSPAITHAHESRPAYLEITEVQQAIYDITWRRPARGDRVLAMQPVFPEHCAIQGKVANYLSSGAHTSRWSLECKDRGLADQTIAIDGLAQTITDVLVRIQFLDGTTLTQILKPNATAFVVEGSPDSWKVMADYFVLGVEHILGGIDHLLFVLCLLLIVKGNWLLVKTITAFTIAHSITLAMATLGFVKVPQAPIEAMIALSILFLAVELVKQQEGESDIAIRAPWIVAFIFGLLHGFGFAGALAEVGLPQADIPLALLMFNAGVEAGQLLFIAGVIIIIHVWKYMTRLELTWLPKVTVYAIGSTASFWVIERTMSF